MLSSVVFFLQQGGITSQLILLTMIALIFFTFERVYYLFFHSSFNAEPFLLKIKGLILDRKYTEVFQLCRESSQIPEIRVIRASLASAESGREAMKSTLVSSIVDVSTQVDRHLSYIALIASSATLLGLLGTISGLIKTFSGMAGADPSQKAILLGEGISEAMYSTAAGLVVGLIAMAVHTICSTKATSIKNNCKKAGMDLISWVEKAEGVSQGV